MNEKTNLPPAKNPIAEGTQDGSVELKYKHGIFENYISNANLIAQQQEQVTKSMIQTS